MQRNNDIENGQATLDPLVFGKSGNQLNDQSRALLFSHISTPAARVGQHR